MNVESCKLDDLSFPGVSVKSDSTFSLLLQFFLSEVLINIDTVGWARSIDPRPRLLESWPSYAQFHLTLFFVGYGRRFANGVVPKCGQHIHSVGE